MPLASRMLMTAVQPLHAAAGQTASGAEQKLRLLLSDFAVEPGTCRHLHGLTAQLGLDSISRLALLERLDGAFPGRFHERDVLEAETVTDLFARLQRVVRSEPSALPLPVPQSLATGLRSIPQADVQTLTQVLRFHAAAQPARVHARFVGDDQGGVELSYGGLFDDAAHLAAGLTKAGIQRGDRVALMLPTGPDYLRSFWAALLVGAVPVPLYPPSRPAQLEEHLARQERILENARAALMITVREALPFTRAMKRWLSLRVVTTAEDLREAHAVPVVDVQPEELALLQYTSGSTGDPKGVMLSHRNLLANIRAMGEAVAATPEDVMVSWLPLYHDMGLIGTWLAGLYFGFPVVLMSPLQFLARPVRWLETLSSVRGTLSAAPNFAYELCLHRIRDEQLTDLDLSAWRFALNGSEAISAETVEAFCTRFARAGFRRKALAPAYGLAECSVGLTFPPLMRGPCVDRVLRAPLARDGVAQSAPDETSATAVHELVACGRPLRGHEVRIVDAQGRECADRHAGEIEFRGPSATRGYFGRSDANTGLFHDGWLRTGDLGYVAAGDLYLTGRTKDMIIRAGQHIFPQEVEQAVGALSGVRAGCVAAFASGSGREPTEGLIVVAETRERDPASLAALSEQIQRVIGALLGAGAERIVLVPPNSVPKTSSGKLRRSACRLAYERGTLAAPGRSPFVQLVHVRWRGIVTELASLRRAVSELSYAAQAWSAFVAVAVPAWLLVLVLPRPAWRLALARGAARLLGRLTCVQVRIEGLEHLPEGPCVLVANHQSNVDPFVLFAVIPRALRVVSKAELMRHWYTRLPLDRLDAEYVERNDPTASVSDARRIAERARDGATLLFFPEGTHTRIPGLLSFHMGAFVVAAQASLPVVPIVLTGTRSILRSDTWFPRRGGIHVQIGVALFPHGAGFDAALALKRAARACMLEQTHEPDLDQAP
jgi:1-acyl-sn-glycerol-3-phosphate acyltransferase